MSLGGWAFEKRNDLKFTEYIVQYIYSEKMGKNPNFQIHPSDRFLLGGSTFVDNKFNKTLNLKTLKPNPEPLKVEFGNTATMAVYGLRSPINSVNVLVRPEVLKHVSR